MYVCLRICCFLDILNCIINNHNCSQKCVEVEGSFNCSCYPGYKLQEDEVNCIGTYAKLHMQNMYACMCRCKCYTCTLCTYVCKNMFVMSPILLRMYSYVSGGEHGGRGAIASPLCKGSKTHHLLSIII